MNNIIQEDVLTLNVSKYTQEDKEIRTLQKEKNKVQ